MIIVINICLVTAVRREYGSFSEREREIQNELRKHLPSERELLEIFGQFADHKKVRVWISETLAWDLNLPMTTGPPFLPDFLQAFVICVGRPPLLLTLWDKGDHSAEVETYCSDTARVLHWSLLHFCHLDFTVLRVSATRQDFLRETVSLEEEVKAKAAKARRYFKSPMNLTENTFTVLRDATTALVGATFVPCLLEDVPRDEVRNSHCLSLCLCLSVILCFYLADFHIYQSFFFMAANWWPMAGQQNRYQANIECLYWLTKK